MPDRVVQRLEIAADEHRLSEVRDFVERTCGALGYAPRTLANIRLAVDEACTNVVKHAYAGTPGKLCIKVEARRGWLEIRILDQGTPFDGRVALPQLGQLVNERRKGGLGVFLMHRLMDDVRYRTTPAGNEWILRKRLPGTGSGFARRMHRRYGGRAAAALCLLTVAVCVPLGLHDARQRTRAEERSLQELAFGLAEAARPALVRRVELSPEQTHLFEAVHALAGREPRLLTVHVVDTDGVIWAADRASAAFTKFLEPDGLGTPDALGVRRARQRIDGRPVLHLAVAVRVAQETLGSVHLTFRWEATEQAVHRAWLRLAGAALLVDAIGLALVALLLGTFLRPLQHLVDGLRGLGQQGDLGVDAPEEMGAIAAALDDLSARYHAARESAAECDRLQQEMQVAREIQESILPQAVPAVPGFEIARLYRPAQAVGGDYYDFLDAGEGLTGVVVADVAGKGVPGSLVMSMVRTALRMETRRNAHAGDVLARLHSFVAGDLRKGMFITMLYVVLDSRHRVVSYASAGHTPLLLYRAASDETYVLQPRGIPVGLAGSDARTFERHLDVERLRLQQGDLLLLYTDGITEARNEAGAEYGEARLREALGRWGKLSAAEFVRHLEDDLAAFVGAAAAADDVTLVAIKEQEAAPVVQGALRQKLVDLVENQGVPVVEACRRLKVSPSTYYRFKQRESTDDVEQQHFSIEKRARLGRLVAAHPEYGARDLAAALRAPEWGGVEATPALVHVELRRLDLATPEARRAWAEEGARRAPAKPGAEAAPSGPIAPPDPIALPEPIAPPEPSPPLASPASEVAPLAEIAGAGLRGIVEMLAPGIGLVRLEGCVDSGSCDLVAALLARAGEIAPALVVDLSQVVYVSSRGWGMLAAARTERSIVLCGLRPEVRDVYKMLGFEAVLAAPPDRAAARAALEATASGTTPTGAGTAPDATGRTRVAPRNGATNAGRPPVGPVIDPSWRDLEGEWESLRVSVGTTGTRGDLALVALAGVLDTVSAYRFESALGQMVDGGARRILVDLSCVEFVSSAGWGAFTSHLERLRGAGGDLRLFGMNSEVARIHGLLHLGAVLRSFDLLPEALASFETESVECAGETDAGGAMSEAAAAAGPATPSGATPPPEDVVACGVLSARLAPLGAGGRASRLVLEGTLDGADARALGEALAAAALPPLLLVDARGLVAAEATGWEALAKALRGRAAHLRVLARPGLAPPAALALAVHGSLPEALLAAQRTVAPLLRVRLPAEEFAKDHETRREGWPSYVALLRSVRREEAA